MKQNAHNASGHYCTTVHRVRSVNSHSIKECELSFHQTSYKRYTTMCDVYIIHIQGATVCYIHPPEKKREKLWCNHTCTLPHPAPNPSSNPTAACPPTCATHPRHLRSSADTSSLPLWSLLFMKGKRREKEKFFFLSLSLAAAAWLLCCWKRHLLRQWPKDGQFPHPPPPHPWPTPSLSSIFPVPLFQTLQ